MGPYLYHSKIRLAMPYFWLPVPATVCTTAIETSQELFTLHVERSVISHGRHKKFEFIGECCQYRVQRTKFSPQVCRTEALANSQHPYRTDMCEINDHVWGRHSVLLDAADSVRAEQLPTGPRILW